jgi:hypothetical protein
MQGCPVCGTQKVPYEMIGHGLSPFYPNGKISKGTGLSKSKLMWCESVAT